jgi:hypothetical protein
LQLAKSRSKERGRISLGILLAFLILLLNFLAAAPSLHELIHADAGQAGHQCAVTLFAHGQMDSATVDVLVSAPLTFAATVPCAEFSIFAPAIENLPAGRAPPVSVSPAI